MTGKEARDETRTSDLLFLTIDRFPFHDGLAATRVLPTSALNSGQFDPQSQFMFWF